MRITGRWLDRGDELDYDFNMSIISKLKKSSIIFTVLFCIVIIPQNAADLQDKSDSINYILGIKIDGSKLLELSGAEIREFKLYTTESKSSILWEYKGEYYIYTFSDDNHFVNAKEMFSLISSKGISVFAAQREAMAIRLNKYHKVLAIRVNNH